jgi:hypothetical protein
MTSNAPPPASLRQLTRLQTGIVLPVKYKGLSTTPSVASPVPSNYHSALADPNWQAVMADEFEDHVWFEDRWMVASLCDE